MQNIYRIESCLTKLPMPLLLMEALNNGRRNSDPKAELVLRIYLPFDK